MTDYRKKYLKYKKKYLKLKGGTWWPWVTSDSPKQKVKVYITNLDKIYSIKLDKTSPDTPFWDLVQEEINTLDLNVHIKYYPPDMSLHNIFSIDLINELNKVEEDMSLTDVITSLNSPDEITINVTLNYTENFLIIFDSDRQDNEIPDGFRDGLFLATERPEIMRNPGDLPNVGRSYKIAYPKDSSIEDFLKGIYTFIRQFDPKLSEPHYKPYIVTVYKGEHELLGRGEGWNERIKNRVGVVPDGDTRVLTRQENSNDEGKVVYLPDWHENYL